MSQASDQAVEMFQQGFNCAQSVLTGLRGSKAGLTSRQALRVAQALGGGMCHLDQTCGAVTGALMAIGLAHAARTRTDDGPRQQVTAMVQEFVRRFTARHGAITCTALLGVNLATPEGLAKSRSEGLTRKVCPAFIRDAVETVEKLLEERVAQP